jgi:hypothetical protein
VEPEPEPLADRIRAALVELEAFLEGEPDDVVAEIALPVASALALPEAGFDLDKAVHDAHLFVESYPKEGFVIGNVAERGATWLAQRLVMQGKARERREHARATVARCADEIEYEFPRSAAAFRRLLEETAETPPPEDRLWHALALRIVETQLPSS